MSLTNSVSSKRVGVIYDAHVMNINAQNALLKTLEELPENKFILLNKNSVINKVSDIVIIVIRVLNTQFSKLKLSKIFTSINVITKADIVSKNNLIFFGSLLSLNKSSKSNSFLTSLFNIKIIKDVNIQNNITDDIA